VLLTTDNVDDYKPRFGLRVMDTEHAAILAILDRMIKTENQTALSINVTSVTIGADYRTDESTDDPELDKLLGTTTNVLPMFNSRGKQKVREPILFWINYEVTTPFAKDKDGNDAVIRTDSTTITAKAPRQLLTDLLKVSKQESDLIVTIDHVRSAVAVEHEYELQDLNF